jgi:hypothetical protein
MGCKKHKSIPPAEKSNLERNAQSIEQLKDELKEVADKSQLNLKKAKDLTSEMSAKSDVNELHDIQQNSQSFADQSSDMINNAKSLIDDINSLSQSQYGFDEQQNLLLSESIENIVSCQNYVNEVHDNLQEINKISAQLNQNKQQNNSPDSNKTGLSYRFNSTKVDYSDLNNLPSAPKISELPQGVFSFEHSDANEPMELGMWKQIEGTHDADFLPGNYTDNIWTFRSDNTVEIKRTYGTEHKIRLTWVVKYIKSKDSHDFTILNDPNYQPKIPFMNSDFQKYGILLEQPIRQLPIIIERKNPSDNRVVLSGRAFEKLN